LVLDASGFQELSFLGRWVIAARLMSSNRQDRECSRLWESRGEFKTAKQAESMILKGVMQFKPKYFDF